MQDFDVILLPTNAQAVSYRKRLARTGGPRALFGTAVATPASWLAELWELYGDGRRIVSAVEREVVAMAVCGREGLEPCVARVAVECLAAAAGLPEFSDACDGAAAGGPQGLSGSGLSVACEQARLLAACKLCLQAQESLGLVETGEALRLLAAVLPDAPIRVLAEGLGPLPHAWSRFFAACPQLLVQGLDERACAGLERLSENIVLRFAFPSGRYAQATTVSRLLSGEVGATCGGEGAGPQRVVMACKDPAALFDELSAPLLRRGIGVSMRARRPFARSDLGRAFFAVRSLLFEEPWRVSDATDFLLSPFSGVSTSVAQSFDAKARGDRLTSLDDVVATLRALSANFALFEELVSDAEADILVGLLEDFVSAQVARPASWRHEQLGALSALREVAEAARRFGVSWDACLSLLERIGVDASCALPALGGCTLELLDYRTAAGLEPGCCDMLIAADLTSEAFPSAHVPGAAEELLGALGITAVDDELSRMRRSFGACLRLPSQSFVVLRCLNDQEADPTYPCAVLEEFLDCYCIDPSDPAERDNPYALPEALCEKLLECGEERLYENLRGMRVDQCAQVPVEKPCPGRLSEASKGRLLLPRRTAGKVLDEPCLSPSQIESYLECPYKWFADRRLRLDELDEGFGALQMGDFAHGALKSFYVHFREEVAPKLTPDALPAARAIMQDVLERHVAFQPELKAGSNRLLPLSELEQREVAALCQKLMAYLDYEASLLPSFHPAYLEHDIAKEGAIDYAGCKIIGTADRIDVDAAGNAVVIDYKASVSKEYCLAVRNEGRLGKVQALIYAQAVRKSMGLIPVGALYVRYGKGNQATGAFDPRALDTAHLPKMRHADCRCDISEGRGFEYLLDSTEEQVAFALEGLFAGDVEPRPASVEACKWCPVSSCPERRC